MGGSKSRPPPPTDLQRHEVLGQHPVQHLLGLLGRDHGEILHLLLLQVLLPQQEAENPRTAGTEPEQGGENERKEGRGKEGRGGDRGERREERRGKGEEERGRREGVGEEEGKGVKRGRGRGREKEEEEGEERRGADRMEGGEKRKGRG